MKKNLYHLLFIFSLFFLSKASAQVDIFIKITNPNSIIEGESTVKGYEKQIVATSFAHEENNCVNCTSTTGGGGVSKAKTSNFVFTMNLNKSIIGLKKALYSGDHLDKVVISFVKPNGAGTPTLYYEITLETVFVANITDATSGEPNTNEIQFAAVKYTWKYWQQTGTGTPAQPIQFTWDSSTNTGG